MAQWSKKTLNANAQAIFHRFKVQILWNKSPDGENNAIDYKIC